VDPAGVASALDETARLLAEVAGGTIVAERMDLWPGKEPPKTIPLRRQRLNALLGVILERDVITKSLAGLGIREARGWSGAGAEEAAVYEAPSHRKDLEIEVDLIEEVARVVGYDRVPSQVRIHGAPSTGAGSMAEFLSELTTIGCGLGFDETINTALVGAVPPEVLPQRGEADLWELQNPMSRELKHLRPSLLPGIIQSAARNLRHGAVGVRLVEVGKVFVSSPSPLGNEWWEAALLLAGTPDPWTQRGADSDRYLELKGAVDALLEALGIDSRKTGSYHELCWTQGSGAFVEASGRRLGRLGQVSAALAAAAGLDRPAWAAVLDVAAIQSVRPTRRRFVPLPKYPASKRDLAVVVGREVSQAHVEEVIRKSGGSLLHHVGLFDVYEGEQLGPGERSLAYALEFRSADRTLHDREVDEALQSIVRALGATLGVTLRGGAETHSSVGRKP
jgi:phenylalanyl-tRNA synthetase beta chain